MTDVKVEQWDEKPCCSPTSDGMRAVSRTPTSPAVAKKSTSSLMVDIPGGRSLVGTARPEIPDDGESPLRVKKQDGFRIAPTTVTNKAFSEFVETTGYVTDAEHYGWSFVFYADIPTSISLTDGVVGTEWWRKVSGANWRDIHGPGTQLSSWQPDHPVVHVSWNDACAYAQWSGGRLPTEAEWEHAARGKLGDVRFPWGDEEPDDSSILPCNIWQGKFPVHNTNADGWAGTAPATAFDPNGYGLYNMVGNVWEWTADPFRAQSLKKSVRKKLGTMRGFKILKGGSFLCHRSYCYRYRIAARIGNAPDSTTAHQSFRVVWDL